MTDLVVALQTWQAHIETSLQEVSAVFQHQVHFGVYRRVFRDSDLHLAGCQPHGAFEARRPAGGEQLLGIGASARRAWD